MLSTFMRGAFAAAATLATTAAFASTNLIQNGDFSAPVQSAAPYWSIYSPGVDGWTSLVNDGIEIGASTIYGLPSANAGGQNLELNANQWGTASYTVTGLTPGATYILSYEYGGRTDGGPSSATVSFGGVTLTTNSGSIGHWTSNVFQFVASASSEDLVLTAFQTGNTSYGNEFTNFSLTAAPETSTWAMMGIGFAGLAFAGYRTRRAATSIA